MSAPISSPAYLMGHTSHERRRLSVQASVLNPLTRAFLQRAGISAGMRVLDMGCGVGEVSRVAASLVGPNGHVTGIDIDNEALETARARAREEGYEHVSFEHGAVLDHEPERPYNAVIGRLILIHMPDPVTVLRKAATLTHPGGIVAFQDYDLAHEPPTVAGVPLMARVGQVLIDLFRRAVPYPDIGLRLFAMMQDAGIPDPVCWAESPVGGGPESPVYEWFAETARSVLPKLEEYGIATAAELDLDTLAARLREEAISQRAAIFGPMLVGAFARKP